MQKMVDGFRKWLSYQGPLKDFVCLNPLMFFQKFEFLEGMRRAGQAYGAFSLMDLAFYRNAYQEGRITDSGIDRALSWYVSDASERRRVREDLFRYPEGSTNRPVSIPNSGVRHLFCQLKGVSLKTHATPVLLRLVSNYLDQGVSIWSMPRSDKGFFQTVKDLVNTSFVSFPPLSSSFARSLFELTPEQAIERCLEVLLEDRRYDERYLLDLTLSTAGWSAMVNQVEKQPELLLRATPITLLEYVAVGVILDASTAVQELGLSFKPMKLDQKDSFQLPDETSLAEGTIERIKAIWHEAYELSFYEQAFQVVSEKKYPHLNASEIQAAFCIDDRECSLRRYLETFDSGIETFGTAGFFGMDFKYQYYDDIQPSQNCPVVIKPKHLVRGERLQTLPPPKPSQLFGHMDRRSHTFLGGIFISQVLGVLTAFRLIRAVIRPGIEPPPASAITRDSDRARLRLHREDNDIAKGIFEGYTFDEMADRVASQLLSTGLAKRMAPLVVVVAHGSTTVNNPHYAAYDCGACMGKPGTPNARAFAVMANTPEVRLKVLERGVDIPQDTVFVAALHDTTRDEMMFFDIDDLSDVHSKLLHRFERAAQTALANNAKERCRRFELVEMNISPDEALRHVRERSSSIFEPRPELTHTGNALAIIGRRALTRGYFMDRRAFMNSYDPTLDSDGSILAGILAAVIPVGGGINLTYFFSRMDNEVYGAGTKLSHNVVGLIGVSHGVEGDLLTGLPQQMVEVHEPVRLLVVVEQEPATALAAVQRNQSIYQWVENYWVRYGCVSPSTGDTYLYREGRMEPFLLSELPPLPSRVDNTACFSKSRFYVPLARLDLNSQHEENVGSGMKVEVNHA